MSASQCTCLPVEGDSYPQEDATLSPGRSAPKPSATTLRRSWYSMTSSDDEEASIPVSLAQVLTSTKCETSWQAFDACSEASTDVGVDVVDDAEPDDEAKVEPSLGIEHHQVRSRSAPCRPYFPKLGRQQRVDQLRRVVDEFCAMDFDSVDASCQGGLVLRMLTTLKSLKESTNF